MGAAAHRPQLQPCAATEQASFTCATQRTLAVWVLLGCSCWLPSAGSPWAHMHSVAPSLPQGLDPLPVSDVVEASAVINRLQDSCWRVAHTSTLERKMLWHSGMRAAVCLAPITPAGAQGYDSALWPQRSCRCIGGSGQRSAWHALAAAPAGAARLPGSTLTTEQSEQQCAHCPPAEARQGHTGIRAAVDLARVTPAGVHTTPPCRSTCMPTSTWAHLHAYRGHGSSPPGARGTAKKLSGD